MDSAPAPRKNTSAPRCAPGSPRSSRARARSRGAGRRRSRRPGPGSAKLLRRRLGRDHLAERVRRPRRERRRAAHLQRGVRPRAARPTASTSRSRLSLVGPTLMACGTREQKRRFLPQDPRAATRSGARAFPSRTPAPTSRRVQDARRGARRRDRRHRPEDLDQLRPVCRLVHPGGAHQSQRRRSTRG